MKKCAQMAADDRRDRRQLALLRLPVGAPGSGAARYGAAMHFHNRGRISPEMLEIYRRCCKFDREDPISIARLEGVRGFPADGS